MFIDDIKKELEANGGKISKGFIDAVADKSTTHYAKLGSCTRVCVIELPSGHEVVGYAQVLDPLNDVEEIGNNIAYERAKDEIWSVVGAIAKNFIPAEKEA